jgi:hypothetical protein
MRMGWALSLCVLVAACGDSSGGSQDGRTPGAGPGTLPTPEEIVRDCTWVLHSDVDLMNVAFPDTAANYWYARFAVPPGGEVRLSGAYPYARYMSFNAYDSTLASFDALADIDIRPDDGSRNPFAVGADRYTEARSYTVRIVADPPPGESEARTPNTLYLGYTGAPTPVGSMLYRVYVPDEGTSLSGNTDLPRFHFVLADGTQMSAEQTCDFLEQTRLGLGLNDTLANTTLLQSVSAREGTDPIVWTKFFGFANTVVSIAQYAPVIADLPFDALWQLLNGATTTGQAGGGLLSNRHNAYVSATVNRAFGEIAVISARAATTPDTFTNVPLMQSAQMRYWSMCTNDLYTTRYYDCAYDRQIPVGRDGHYTIVISTPDLRPANARPECGVTWLNWGPRADSLLIFRNMLPSADFHHAVQDVPDASGMEREVMGDYYPYGLHAGKAEFEALSADPRGDARTCAVNASSLRVRAGSAG